MEVGCKCRFPPPQVKRHLGEMTNPHGQLSYCLRFRRSGDQVWWASQTEKELRGQQAIPAPGTKRSFLIHRHDRAALLGQLLSLPAPGDAVTGPPAAYNQLGRRDFHALDRL